MPSKKSHPISKLRAQLRAEQHDRGLEKPWLKGRGLCGVPWPVCPDCLGVGLHTASGQSWCQQCLRSWPAEAVSPCPLPATELLTDGATTARVCASHAKHPSSAKLRPTKHGHLETLPGGKR